MVKIVTLKKLITISFCIFLSKNLNAEYKHKETWQNTNLFPAINENAQRSKERSALHEAAHLIISEYFLGISKINEITIKNDSTTNPHTEFKIHPENKHDINIMLASYIIEEMFFNNASTGIYSDLEYVIEDVLKFYPQTAGPNIIEIKNILQNYINETKNIILQNIDKIKIFSNILLTEKDTLNNAEITAIFNKINNNLLTISQ